MTIVKIWMTRQHLKYISKIWRVLNIDVICTWHGTVYSVDSNLITKYFIDLTNKNFFFIKLIKFIASFGGIFGLCLGGSVISLVELLYFFTLRLYSIIINRRTGASSKHGDSKRVSISNNVKTVEINPKSFLQNFKAYQQFERHPKWHRMRPSIFGSSIGSSGTILGKTAIHDFNKPAVHEFLK